MIDKYIAWLFIISLGLILLPTANFVLGGNAEPFENLLVSYVLLLGSQILSLYLIIKNKGENRKAGESLVK